MMTDQERTMKHLTRNEFATPKVVDRAAFQAELDALRLREKAYTKEGDAIAAARRRLPMVEVDGAIFGRLGESWARGTYWRGASGGAAIASA